MKIPIPVRLLLIPAVMALATVLPACHSPKGGLMPHTGGSYTYFSTEVEPKTVIVMDTRIEEPFFEIDIPVGKQLTMQFIPDKGDDPVLRPDLLRYEIMPIGTTTGRLRNQMTVPHASARRIDVYMRDGVEWRDPPAQPQLRPDQEEDRPDWWSPRGGPMPEDTGRTIYD